MIWIMGFSLFLFGLFCFAFGYDFGFFEGGRAECRWWVQEEVEEMVGQDKGRK